MFKEIPNLSEEIQFVWRDSICLIQFLVSTKKTNIWISHLLSIPFQLINDSYYSPLCNWIFSFPQDSSIKDKPIGPTPPPASTVFKSPSLLFVFWLKNGSTWLQTPRPTLKVFSLLNTFWKNRNPSSSSAKLLKNKRRRTIKRRHQAPLHLPAEETKKTTILRTLFLELSSFLSFQILILLSKIFQRACNTQEDRWHKKNRFISRSPFISRKESQTHGKSQHLRVSFLSQAQFLLHRGSPGGMLYLAKLSFV